MKAQLTKKRKMRKRQRLFRRYTGYYFFVFNDHIKFLDLQILLTSFFENRKAKALIMEKAILIDLITLITKPIK